MNAELPTVSIKLWRSDAVVLFGWLTSVDLNDVPIRHPAGEAGLG